MVERWHPTSDSIMLIAKHPCGDYVRYSDYAALEAQLAEAKEGLEWREIKQVVQPRISDGYTAVKLSKPGFWFVKGPGPGMAFSALEATPPAPKVTEVMVETEMVRMTVSETIRAMGANPDEQIIGELTVFDAVAVKVLAALTAAQESGQ